MEISDGRLAPEIAQRLALAENARLNAWRRRMAYNNNAAINVRSCLEGGGNR